MKISTMNRRITFEKNTTVVDDYANHLNEWTEFYSCAAYVSDNTGDEAETAGVIVENKTLYFTVRCCTEISDVTTTNARIKFDGEIYNIVSVDTFNYTRKTLKFKAERAKR